MIRVIEIHLKFCILLFITGRKLEAAEEFTAQWNSKLQKTGQFFNVTNRYATYDEVKKFTPLVTSCSRSRSPIIFSHSYKSRPQCHPYLYLPPSSFLSPSLYDCLYFFLSITFIFVLFLHLLFSSPPSLHSSCYHSDFISFTLSLLLSLASWYSPRLSESLTLFSFLIYLSSRRLVFSHILFYQHFFLFWSISDFCVSNLFQIVTWLRAKAANHTTNANLINMGQTYESRDMWVMQV